jgi:hypothetical protein
MSMRRPPLLFAKGRLELAEGPIVAMVGACNGSAVGRNPRLSAIPSPFLPVASSDKVAIRRPGQSLQARQPARRYTPQPLAVSDRIPLMGPFFPGPFLRAVFNASSPNALSLGFNSFRLYLLELSISCRIASSGEIDTPLQDTIFAVLRGQDAASTSLEPGALSAGYGTT